MPDQQVYILVPRTVQVRNRSAVEARRALNELAQSMLKDLEPKAVEAFVKALSEKIVEDVVDYAVEKLIEVALNNGSGFRGGTKTMAMSFRIQEAFEGAKEGDVVVLSKEQHDALKKWFEDPDYMLHDQQKGKAEPVKGWPIDAYTARQCYPYIDAVVNPVTAEAAEALKSAKAPKPAEEKQQPAAAAA